MRMFVGVLALDLCCWSGIASGHDGHHAATYRVTQTDPDVEQGPHLRLRVLESNGEPVPARFTVTLDDQEYIPATLGEHGLRFVSIHQRRKQQFVATFARGSGDVLIPLPAGTRTGRVTAARGFEYYPAREAFTVKDGHAALTLNLERWVNLQQRGWHAADEHLHYERTDPKHNSDWMTLLAADGLSHAHFLVLRGGNLPGVWAEQYGWGPNAEASNGRQSIRSGEEYRDGTQGHINLLGIEQVIQPISTGGIGTPKISFNYPPLLDVFDRTHELGGIGGPAHGASLARSSTAVLDTVMGRVDFFEIANTHLYKTDVWYELLNAGYIVPPVAGTDLPNFGFRDDWQPLLGEVRTYVRSGADIGFEAWKKGLLRGEVFVTSGPIIDLEVDGVGPGGTVRLPPEGGSVTVLAKLTSPRPLQRLEVVVMGQVAGHAKAGTESRLHKAVLKHTVSIDESCWIAARGTGGPKQAVEKGLNIEQSEFAHSGIVRVLVGDEPVRSSSAVARLREQLVAQREHYRTMGRYERAEHRLRFVKLFDSALDRLTAPRPERP